MPEGRLPFLRGRISATDDYRSPQGGGGEVPIPRRNARAQSRALRQQLESVAQAVAARAAGTRDPAASREIVIVVPEPGFPLKLESLGDDPTDVRVVARDPVTGAAILDSADPALTALGRKVTAYGDPSKRTPKKGVPLNEPALAPITAIRLAELPDLAGPLLRAADLAGGVRRWFELACRGGSRRPAGETNGSRQQVQRQLERLQLPMAREFSTAEEVVFYFRSTLDELRQLLSAIDCCYEVELVEPRIRDWLLAEEQPAREIGEFALEPPGSGAPVVVLLDTGIRTQQPLLREAILSAGSVVPGDVSPEDTYRHGTEMAGVALHGGDLGAAVEAGTARAEHWLQSVRILVEPATGAAAEENRPWWPRLTQDAVAQAEATEPERQRAFTLAVTAAPLLEPESRSLWSTAVDQLAFNDGAGRLICVSAGNADVDSPAFLVGYPQLTLTSKLQDLGQAFNALTVGAFTEKLTLPPDRRYQDATIVAPAGGISPSTCAGPVGGSEAIKPDVVFEGGNVAVSGTLADPFVPTLCTLTTGMDFLTRPLSWIAQTSEAVARAGRLAARIWAVEPDLRPETVRGLIVHSADWTTAIRAQFRNLDERLAISGYGIPDEGLAMECALERATVIVEDEVANAVVGDHGRPRRQVRFFRLPTPEALAELGDAKAELRVTLSYFAEPNLARRRVARGLDLKWEMQGPAETEEAFQRRVNLLRRPKGVKEEHAQGFGWEIGPQRRGRGTVQSDRWRGPASLLAGSKLIAVAPVLGWWDDRKEMTTASMRFSLIVSVRVANVDIYNAIEIALQTPVVIDVP